MPFKPKLTPLQVTIIQKNPRNLTVTALAKLFGVSRRAINFVQDPLRRVPVEMRPLAIERKLVPPKRGSR